MVMSTIQGATWSKVYINDQSGVSPCRKCHASVRVGDAFQFVGGWNTAIIWCARCSPIIRRDPASVKVARDRMMVTTCPKGHTIRLNGRRATFCLECCAPIPE